MCSPGKIAVAENNHVAVIHKRLENITVTDQNGQDPAYKEEA